MIKSVSETIKNEPKEQRGGILRMLLGTLGANLLEHSLPDKGVKRWKSFKITEAGIMTAGKGTVRAGERTTKAGQDFWCCVILELILKYKNIITKWS